MNRKKVATVLLHVGYWCTYVLMFHLFLMIAASRGGRVSFRAALLQVLYSPGTILLIGPAVLSFYLFYTVIFSRFLQRRRFGLLASYGLLTIVGSVLLAMGIVAYRMGPRSNIHLSWDTAAETAVLSVQAGLHAIMGLVMRGFISWYYDIQVKDQLRQKNFETELALVKSQINPHFLFNTLNNIDVLIEKDPGMASRYLNQLSDMQRFMLYETKSEKIPIEKELNYIEKYIQLQKIRTTHPEYISYVVEGIRDGRMVEPMLFIPFIENAFKHAAKKAVDAIRIRITFEEKMTIFYCENKYEPGTVDHQEGGLGNGLIRRRLALLYPDSHTLEVNAAGDTYKAILTLLHVD